MFSCKGKSRKGESSEVKEKVLSEYELEKQLIEGFKQFSMKKRHEDIIHLKLLKIIESGEFVYNYGNEELVRKCFEVYRNDFLKLKVVLDNILGLNIFKEMGITVKSIKVKNISKQDKTYVFGIAKFDRYPSGCIKNEGLAYKFEKILKPGEEIKTTNIPTFLLDKCIVQGEKSRYKEYLIDVDRNSKDFEISVELGDEIKEKISCFGESTIHDTYTILFGDICRVSRLYAAGYNSSHPILIWYTISKINEENTLKNVSTV